MPNYTDPSGYASWWVNDGETPEQAKARIDAATPAGSQTLSQQLQQAIGNPQGTGGAPATASDDPNNPTAWPTNGTLTLYGPGDEEKKVPYSDLSEIDRLTRGGWVPKNAKGTHMIAVDWKGGQMFIDPDTGRASPLNVIMGGQPTAAQTAGMGEFMNSPTYGDAIWNFNNPGQPRPGPTVGGPTTGGGGGGTGGGTGGTGGGTSGGPGGSPYNTQGGTNATVPTGPINLQSDFQGSLSQLINQALSQGQLGQQNLGNVGSQLNNFLGTTQGGLQNAMAGSQGTANSLNYLGAFNQAMASQQYGTGQELLQQLLGVTSPGLQQTTQNTMGAPGNLQTLLQYGLANAQQQQGTQNYLQQQLYGQISPALQSALQNQNQGLDPSVQAALNTQAMDTTSQQYNNARKSLMTQLMQQGAIGGQQPGSEGQIISGLGNLDIAQQQQQSQLQQQGILANQQAINQNRQNAMSAIGQGSNLANIYGQIYNPNAMAGLASQNAGSLASLLSSSLGQGSNLAGTIGSVYNPTAAGTLANQNYATQAGIYNPNAYLGAQGNTLSSLLSGAQAGGQLGINAAQTGGQIAGIQGPLQPGSTQNTILGALLSSGVGALSNAYPSVFGTNGGTGGGGGGPTFNINWGNTRTPPYVPQ